MAKRVEVHGATPVKRERPDRLKWRVRLKSNPATRVWFRAGVAVVGVGLIIAALLTGWLPGPGGIPLLLTGLAVLSTEFLWAKRFNKWLLRHLRVYLAWPPARKRNFWLVVVVVVCVLWWSYLAVAGVPAWLPQWLARWLRYLPAVA